MRRSILVGVMFLVLVFSNAYADPGDTLWTRTYGGSGFDEAEFIISTSDGNYIASGHTQSFGAGGSDAYLIKFNEYGDTMWTNTYGYSDDEQAYGLIETSDGNLIFVGHTRSFGNGRSIYLVKADSMGNVIWERVYFRDTYDSGFRIMEAIDEGFIIIGFTATHAGNKKAYVIKTNDVGDTLWTRVYPDMHWAFDFAITEDSCYSIAGLSQDEDAQLMKINVHGDSLWARNYGGNGHDTFISMTPAEDNHYLLAGESDSHHPGNSDCYIVKVDSMGDVLWSRTYGDVGREYANKIIQTNDLGIVISGNTTSFGGDNDFYFIKLDENGQMLWDATYGGMSDDDAADMVQTTSGDFIVAGWTMSFGAGDRDVYLLKISNRYNPDITNITHSPQIPLPNEPCEVSAIITDEDGAIDYADLYYDNGSGYVSMPMNNIADSFYASIPGQDEGTLVDFYITAVDDEGYATTSDTGTFYVSADNAVSIYMVPINPPIEVAPGGNFRFVGVLSNDTPIDQTADVWLMLELPGGTTYGPISKFNSIPLAPEQIIVTNGIRQDIPVYAPAGTYEYWAYCGYFPDIIPEYVFDSTSFSFTVTSSPLSGGADDWILSGWFDGESTGELPSEIALLNNYPNPFNATTVIPFNLSEAGDVSIKVYNLAGQLVETLVDGYKDAGSHEVNWDASAVSSGIYFYTLETNVLTTTKKMNLLK